MTERKEFDPAVRWPKLLAQVKEQMGEEWESCARVALASTYLTGKLDGIKSTLRNRKENADGE